jgi:hypothetical protein
MLKPVQIFVVASVSFVHLLLILIAISWLGALGLHADLRSIRLPFALGLVMAQNSLFVMFALHVRLPGYIRTLSFFAGWLVACVVMAFVADQHLAQGRLVLVGTILAAQSCMLAFLSLAVSFMPRRIRDLIFEDAPRRSRRFRIMDVLLWTTVIAILFGVGRFFVVEYRWDIGNNYLNQLPIYLPLAGMNTLIAVSAVVTYWPRDWRARGWLLAGAVVVTTVCGTLCTLFVGWIDGELSWRIILWHSMLFAIQFILLHGTLASVTASGLWRDTADLWPERDERELLPPSFFADEET